MPFTREELEAMGGGQQQPQTKSQPSVAEDISNVAGPALRTGIEMIPGGPGETSKIPPTLARKLMQMLGADEKTLADYDASLGRIQQYIPDLGTVKKYVTDPILGEGQPADPQTGIGKVVRTGLENAPSVMMNPGSWVSKGLQLGGSTLAEEGAVQGAEGIADYFGKELDPRLELALRMGGSTSGQFAPSAFNRASNPRPIPPERQPHVDELRSRNVPITAGQLSGNERLLARESIADTPPRAKTEQGPAFTREVMKEQGGFPAGSDSASRSAMNVELNRMGREFDRLAQISRAPFDQTMVNDLTKIVEKYKKGTAQPVPLVESVVNDLFDNAMNLNNGMITGDVYKRLRTDITDTIGSDATDSATRKALLDIKETLDDAINGQLPPEEQAKWADVRRQYRNYLPIEYAKGSGTAETAKGNINPSQLTTGIRNIEGRKEISSGDRPLTRLAESGKAVLDTVPNSGTGPRTRNALGSIAAAAAGTGIGGAAQFLTNDPVFSTAAGLLGSGIPKGIEKVGDAFVSSDIGQKIMSRQGPTVAKERELLAAMLAASRATALQHNRKER